MLITHSLIRARHFPRCSQSSQDNLECCDKDHEFVVTSAISLLEETEEPVKEDMLCLPQWLEL